MRYHQNEFADLAARAEHGDGAARGQLRGQLNATLPQIVREALRPERVKTALVRWVRTEALKAGANADLWSPEGRKQVILQVARRLRDAILDGLMPSPEAKELLANETVRAL